MMVRGIKPKEILFGNSSDNHSPDCFVGSELLVEPNDIKRGQTIFLSSIFLSLSPVICQLTRWRAVEIFGGAMANIQRALLSVSDKTGLIAFAQALAEAGIELVSTGGTAWALRES